MADIAIHRIPRSLRGRTFAKQALRRALLAGLAGVFVVAAARFGHDWWTVGRFIETTDDAYVGGNVTRDIAARRRVRRRDRGQRQSACPRRAAPDRLDAAIFGLRSIMRRRRRQRQAALANLEARARSQQSMIAQAQADVAPRRRRRPSPHWTILAISASPRPDTGPGRRPERSSALSQAAQSALVRPAPGSTPRGSSSPCSMRRSSRRARRSRRPKPTCSTRAAQSWLHGNPLADRRLCRQSRGASRRLCRRPAPISSPSCPRAELWVDANFKEDQLARMRPGEPATVVADVLPEPRVPRPCRKPRARHRRDLQRHSAGERDRQFHQDRAARAGAHRARRRRSRC